jgi:photosystem II stability/assembly factor-like uncharacterized protein
MKIRSLLRITIFCLSLHIQLFAKIEQSYSWVEVGSDINKNAMIMGLASANDGKVYSGSAGKGTYVSSDNGTTWTKKVMGDADHDNGVTTSIYVHPNGKIYAGQSNGFVFVSDDNGETFHTLTIFSSSDPRPVSFADDSDGNVYFIYSSGESEIYRPDNSELKTNMIVYFNVPIWSMDVDKQGNMYASTMGEGIYKSTDKGDNWVKINTGLTSLDVHKVIAADNGVLFAGLSGDGGLYKSIDGGQSWQESMNGMGSLIVMDIIFGKDNTIFAATTKDIFRSDDFGNSWVSIKGDLPDLTNYRRLTLDSKNYIYVGGLTGKIYRTKDPIQVDKDYLSIQVEPIAPVSIAPGKAMDFTITIRDFENNPVENADVYISDEVNNSTQSTQTTNEGKVIYNLFIPTGGVIEDSILRFSASKPGYKDTDTIIRIVHVRNEDAWLKVESYIYNERIISIETAGQDKIFLGTAGASLIGSTNSGNDWFFASNGISMINSVYKIVKDKDGSIIMATDWDGILKSTNFGSTWTKLETGFERTSNVAIGEDGTLFAVDFNGVTVRSTDKGATWQSLSNYPGTIKSVSGILALDKHVFIAGGSAGLYESLNNGDDWSKITSGIEGLSITAISKSATGDLYLGTDNMGVFSSSNGGLDWSAMNAGISDFNIKGIISDKGQLFALAFGKGVWYSDNKGMTWKEFNEGFEGLSFMDVYGFAVSEDGFLYAGAFDKGLYKRKKPNASPTDVIPEIEDKIDFSVYPNPITGDATIYFDRQKEGLAELSVYDLMGNKITTLLDGKIEIVNYYINWDTNGLPNGPYFLKFRIGNVIVPHLVVINN